MLSWMELSPPNRQLCGIPQGGTLGPLLFLIYINGLPNSSQKLGFIIFADDINVFASTRDLKSLEHLMNSELTKVKRWCDVNKLSINRGENKLHDDQIHKKKGYPNKS